MKDVACLLPLNYIQEKYHIFYLNCNSEVKAKGQNYYHRIWPWLGSGVSQTRLVSYSFYPTPLLICLHHVGNIQTRDWVQALSIRSVRVMRTSKSSMIPSHGREDIVMWLYRRWGGVELYWECVWITDKCMMFDMYIDNIGSRGCSTF